MHMMNVRKSPVDPTLALRIAEDLRQREHLIYGFSARCATPRNQPHVGFGSSAPRRRIYEVEAAKPPVDITPELW